LSLSFYQAYRGESLHFHDGGFPNLKELHIDRSPYLKSIVIDKGAMQSLKKSVLSHSPYLETVHDIQHLEKLEVLEVDFENVELRKTLRS
jgi:hypothetical protein